jgi:hypothetical protein
MMEFVVRRGSDDLITQERWDLVVRETNTSLTEWSQVEVHWLH